jgi:hypothetical protein
VGLPNRIYLIDHVSLKRSVAQWRMQPQDVDSLIQQEANRVDQQLFCLDAVKTDFGMVAIFDIPGHLIVYPEQLNNSI